MHKTLWTMTSLLLILLLCGCGATARLSVVALRAQETELITLQADSVLSPGDRFKLRVYVDAPAYVYALEGNSVDSAKLLTDLAAVHPQRGLAVIPRDHFLEVDPLAPDGEPQSERVYVVVSRTPMTEDEIRKALHREIDGNRGRTGTPKPTPAKGTADQKDSPPPATQTPPKPDSSQIKYQPDFQINYRGPIRLVARLTSTQPAVLYFEYRIRGER